MIPEKFTYSMSSFHTLKGFFKQTSDTSVGFTVQKSISAEVWDTYVLCDFWPVSESHVNSSAGSTITHQLIKRKLGSHGNSTFRVMTTSVIYTVRTGKWVIE